jgi:hypothetical protein
MCWCFFVTLTLAAPLNSKAVGAARSQRLCLLPIGVAWAHGIGGCRTDMGVTLYRSGQVKYTPRRAALKATPD